MLSVKSYAPNFLDSLGVLAQFSFSKTIWKEYEGYAIDKIHQSNLSLRGAIHYAMDLKPKQAAKVLKDFTPILNLFDSLMPKVREIDDPEMTAFKNAVIDLCATSSEFRFVLQELSETNMPYIVSHPTLAADWDSEEDQHWDNYIRK